LLHKTDNLRLGLQYLKSQGLFLVKAWELWETMFSHTLLVGRELEQLIRVVVLALVSERVKREGVYARSYFSVARLATHSTLVRLVS
jgi:hypothetical protein